MGDGEMALVPGVQYGLSSHSYLGEHKSLIFTKLTDSASRSIQEYLKNRHKLNQKPTIQFLGNEGQLSIPSSHGLTEFNFLFNNQDIENPQNGFECVQQVSHKNLDNLGNLSYKLWIQANDDVYETTRHRMAVAEENNKNKCTRVIKANGPDIGRKVKVKGTGRIIPPPYAKHRESTTSIPTSGSSQSKASTNKPAASNSSSNHLATSRSPEKKISDLITRRPLKERLIHLLAVRSYKKPEIYDRIIREGIRERERSIIMTVLKQVAIVRDNTYILQRHFWNDVQEDWPFYNDQEKATLKRNKPQNLTPPASDGSSGSGHSPNSIHAGSPPAITAPPVSLQGNKRPGYYQGSDGLPTKKPRISHYRKPEPIAFVSSSAPERASSGSNYNNNNSSGVSATTIDGDRTAGTTNRYVCGANSNSAGKRSDGFLDAWGTSSQQTQRERNSRVDYRAERIANSDVLRDTGNSYGAVASAVAAISDGSSNRPSCLTSSPSDSARNNHPQMAGHERDSGITTTSGSAKGSLSEVNIDRREKSDRSRGAREERERGNRERENRERENRERENKERENRERESRNRSTAAALGANNVYNEASSSGAPTYNANSTNNANAAVAAVAAAAATGSLLERPVTLREYPDYLTDYTTVNSVEQKRRYKEDFAANYDEYRKLHAKMVIVGQHFATLYNLMQEEKDLGNTTKAQAYKDQIHRDYEACKKNQSHLQMKTRFDYLNDKLSHIKRLILEYESATSNNGVNAVVNATSNTNTTNIGDINSRHY